MDRGLSETKFLPLLQLIRTYNLLRYRYTHGLVRIHNQLCSNNRQNLNQFGIYPLLKQTLNVRHTHLNHVRDIGNIE